MRLNFIIAVLLIPLLLSGCVFDWSPDGKSYVNYSYSQNQLVITNVNDRSRVFIPESREGSFPVWSPDGRHILFRKSVPDNTTYVYDRDDAVTRIIKGDRFPLFYAWANDGQQFVTFVSPPQEKVPFSRKGSPPPATLSAPGKVTRARPQTNKIYKFTWRSLPSGNIERELSFEENLHLATTEPILFLPGTNEIAFLSIDSGERAKNLCMTEGSRVEKVTSTGDVAAFGISTDKQNLLWMRLFSPETGKPPQVFARNLKTRTVSRLKFSYPAGLPQPDTVRGWHSDAIAGFSPDGSKLVMVDTFPFNTGGSKSKKRQYTACYQMNIDGSGLKELYRSAPFNTPLEGEDREWNYSPMIVPRWSRDGGRLGLYINNTQTGEETFIVYDRFGSRFKVMEHWNKRPAK